MYSPPRVGKEERNETESIIKVNSSIVACERENNINMGIYEHWYLSPSAVFCTFCSTSFLRPELDC